MRMRPEFDHLGSAPVPTWLEDEGIADASELEPKPFDAEEFAARVGRIRAELERRALAGVLVFRPSSVEYLCGHHTVETAPQPVLVTAEAVRIYVPDPEVGRALATGSTDSIAHYAPSEDAIALICEDVARICARAEPGAGIAIEDRDPTVPPRAVALLEAAGISVAAGEYLVETLRLVLSPAEIRCMDLAAEATRRGVEAAYVASEREGVTDSQLAAEIGEALRGEADSSAAMDVIVATGPRGGVPHSSFRDIPLSSGPTFIEFAGTHHRYHAPVMVTVARRVDDLARRLEEISQTILATVLETAAPGKAACEVARAVEAKINLEDRDIFHFNFGYAIGLAHPPGWLDGAPFSMVVDNQAVLEEGMAFHIPASLRSFARCGVGLSHATVLEAAGARVLTGDPEPAIRVFADGSG